MNHFIVLGLPQIKILVQPVDKFRFRYKSEMMGTHGSLLGEKDDTSQRKEVPTVEVSLLFLLFNKMYAFKSIF